MAQVRPYKCYLCPHPTYHNSRAALHVHKARYHALRYGGSDLQDEPWTEDNNPFEQFPQATEIQETYYDNVMFILHKEKTKDPVVKQFNFPLNGYITNTNIELQMHYIYRHGDVKNAYRIQLAAGVILYNRTTKTYRYFKPSSNLFLLQIPLKIWNKSSLDAAISDLIQKDLDAHIRTLRPASDYNVLFITNIEYFVYVSDFPLRGDHLNQDEQDNQSNSDEENDGYYLPYYVRRTHAVVTQFKVPGYENCCALVALAQHILPDKDPRRVVTKVKELHYQWVTFHNARYPHETKLPKTINDFPGIPLTQMAKFEDCFEINVTVMRLQANETVITEFTSSKKYHQTMYMNVYKSHLNLIAEKHIDSYAKAYSCRYCSKLFKRRWNNKVHEVGCVKMSGVRFSGGFYRYKQNLFEKLENVGVYVPKEHRVKTDFVMFDLEAILEKCEIQAGQSTKYINKHRLVSVAFASSVPGYTDTQCFVHQNPDEIIHRLMRYITQVREKSVSREICKFEIQLDELEHKLKQEKRRCLEQNEHSIDTTDPKNRQLIFRSDHLVRQLAYLLKEFYRYISQLPVLAYNASR